MPGRHAIGSLLGGGNDREPLHGRDHWDHRLATEASFQSKISMVRGRRSGPEEILQRLILRKRCCRQRYDWFAKARPWFLGSWTITQSEDPHCTDQA